VHGRPWLQQREVMARTPLECAWPQDAANLGDGAVRAIFLAVVAIGLGLVYLKGGNRVDEDDVRGLVARSQQGFVARDADALCGLMHEDYEQTVQSSDGQSMRRKTSDRDETCDLIRQTLERLYEVEHAAGRPLARQDQVIEGIVLAPDRSHAVARIRTTLHLPGARMVSSERITVERRRWRTWMMANESRSAAMPSR